ncbi:hypothetical protein L218DRAFT_952030, partial [Marasmius fiardii PR-910]
MAKAQAQDLAHALANLKAIFKGLKRRLGIDGFFLIVNSHVDTQADPFWWFSQEEIKTYMPTAIRGGWNMAEIGLKVQSYCIVGYDAANLCHNNKGKIGVLKIQCCDLVTKSLAEVTGCSNPKVHYKNVDKMLTKPEGVYMEGWIFEEFKNLSNESAPLHKLYMPEEHQDWLKNTYKDDKPRKPQDDAGKKQKNTRENDEGEKEQEAKKNSDEAQQLPAKKRKKSANTASKTAKKTGRNAPKSAKTINNNTESNPLQQPSTKNQSQSPFPIPHKPAPFTLAPLPADAGYFEMHLKEYLKGHFDLSAVKPIWDIIFREESGGWDMETQLRMT